MEFVRPWMKSK